MQSQNLFQLFWILISFGASLQSEIVGICRFYQHNLYNYSCEISFDEFQNENEVVAVIGEHIQSKNDDDVQYIHRNLDSFVPNIPMALCQQFSNLRRLSIMNAKLEAINKNSFKLCTNLQFLDLRFNMLESIPSKVFERNTKLTELYISDNKISKIDTDGFVGIKNLNVLYLYSNDIAFLNSNWFKSMDKLRELWLYDNMLTELPNDVFNNLESLTSLYLYHNRLTELPPNLFKTLNNLQILSIHSNYLTTLNSNSFGSLSLSHLKKFSFYKNKINAIDEKIFDLIGSEIVEIYSRDNLCINGDFTDIKDMEQEVIPHFQECFKNFEMLSEKSHIRSDSAFNQTKANDEL